MVSRLLAGTAFDQHAKMVCRDCGAECTTTCRSCSKAFCTKHLYKPANALVTELEVCLACAEKANELFFTETVSKALGLLFSLGISGVTIHSPNGTQVTYDRADVMAGIATGVPHDTPLGAVTKLETGDVLMEGIFTRDNLLDVLEGLGWTK